MSLFIRKLKLTLKTIKSVIHKIWTGNMAKDPGAVIISVHTKKEVETAVKEIEQQEIREQAEILLQYIGKSFDDVPSIKPKLKN